MFLFDFIHFSEEHKWCTKLDRNPA